MLWRRRVGGALSNVGAHPGCPGAAVRWLAGSFFGTETKPVQQTSNAGAVDAHTPSRKLDTQFIKRQIAVRLYALVHKLGVPGKLATTHAMALPARLERTRLGFELHQIIHKSR